MKNSDNYSALYKLGIVVVSNKNGNHANLFIICSNSGTRDIIENNIASYKTSSRMNDIKQSQYTTSLARDIHLRSVFYEDNSNTILTNFNVDSIEIHSELIIL